MKTSRIIGVASGILAAGIVLSCDRDSTPFTTQSANENFKSTLGGRVADQKGVPLKGALVTALPGGATTVTGDSGKFELTLAAGNYKIAVAKDDYRDTTWADSIRLSLLAKEKQALNGLRLQFRYASVKGQVVDEFGAPLPGAGVTVQDQDIASMAVDGSFRLSRIEPGRVRLFTALSGVGYGTVDTVLKAGETLDRLALRIANKGGSVSGRILRSANQGIVRAGRLLDEAVPVAGATVSAVGGVIKTTTAADGSFTLATVPGGGSVLLTVVTPTGDTQKVSGVSVTEGKLLSIGNVSVGTSSVSASDSTVRPALAFGNTTDSFVVLMARTGNDTALHVLKWLWNWAGTRWDTTAVGNCKLSLANLGWAEGSHTVRVKALFLDPATGLLVASAPVALQVNLITPPDEEAPTITRISPVQTVGEHVWTDSVVVAKWTVSDKRKLGQVTIDSVIASPDSGFYKKTVRLKVGTTVVRIEAKDSAGNLSRDSIVAIRLPKPGADSSLAGLSVSLGKLSPDFASGATDFADTVAVTDSVMEILASSRDTAAKVFIDGIAVPSGATYTLALGAPGTVTTVRISVRAVLGDSLAYLVRVYRASPPAPIVPSVDTLLARLLVDKGVLSPSYSAAVRAYLDTVGVSDSVVSIVPLLADTAGRLFVQGSAWVSGKPYSLSLGAPGTSAWARFVVRNSTGDTLSYTVQVVRSATITVAPKANDSSLWKLAVGKGTLTPSFKSTVLSYTDTVAATDSVLAVTTIANDTTASVTVNGRSGSLVSIALGAAGTLTNVNVVVRAKDGDTLSYRISVWRKVATVVVDTSATQWNPKIVYDSFVDARDGKTYKSVRLGNQTWMAENLNFKGTGADTVGRCYLDNTANCKTYGRLYGWSQAMGIGAAFASANWTGSDVDHQGVCPVGWHLPSDAEWTVLQNTVDTSKTMEGTLLKSRGGWSAYQTNSGNGNDSLGFRILPAGGWNAGYQVLGTRGYFWNATASDSTMAYTRSATNSSTRLTRTALSKANFFSVRCLRNASATQIDTSTRLASLAIDSAAISPTFDSATTGYQVVLPKSATTMRLAAVASSKHSSITYNGSANRNVTLGTDTTVKVAVVNAGVSRIYTVSIRTKLDTVKMPVFVTATGTFSGSVAVTISDSTSGATIYYTTNGATPSATSTKYIGPITLTSTSTIRAIAIKTGSANSAIASATYTVASLPIFSPAGGIVLDTRTVRVAAPGADSVQYSKDSVIWHSDTAALIARGSARFLARSWKNGVASPMARAFFVSLNPTTGSMYAAGTNSFVDSLGRGIVSDTLVPSNIPSGATITFNGLASGAITESVASVLVKVVGGTVAAVDTVRIAQDGIVVKSTLASGQKFDRVYRPRFFVDSTIDTTGLTLHFSLDGSATTANSKALSSGSRLGFAGPALVRVSPWRGNVRIGPDQAFDYLMDSCLYDFNAPDSDAVGVPDPNPFMRSTKQFVYGWTSGTSTGSSSTPVSNLSSGKQLQLEYSLDGTTYPSVGIGVMLPWNPLTGQVTQDMRALKSISVTLRDTRGTGSTKVGKLGIKLQVDSATDPVYFEQALSGNMYSYDFTMASGVKSTFSIPVSSFKVPSFGDETLLPKTFMEQLATAHSFQFGEPCTMSSCTAQSGTLEIDDLVFHFK